MNQRLVHARQVFYLCDPSPSPHLSSIVAVVLSLLRLITRRITGKTSTCLDYFPQVQPLVEGRLSADRLLNYRTGFKERSKWVQTEGKWENQH